MLNGGSADWLDHQCDVHSIRWMQHAHELPKFERYPPGLPTDSS